MSQWTPWEWISYACLGISAAGIALSSLPKQTKARLEGWSRFFKSPKWSFVPAIFFVIATIIFVIRLLSAPEVRPASQRIVESQPNRVNDPIVSANVTIVVNVPKDKPEDANGMGAGAEIKLGRDDSILLAAETNQYSERRTSDGQAQFRFTASAPVDSPYMGQPVAKLLDARYIQVDFSDHLVPKDTDIEGQIVWAVNSSFTFKFQIPHQRVSDSRIVIRDLKDGFAPLKIARPK